MKNEYTAVLKPDGDWWIGWIEEVPGVNCKEATCEELLETLRVTLRRLPNSIAKMPEEWPMLVSKKL